MSTSKTSTASYSFEDKLEVLSFIWGESDSVDEEVIFLRETYNIGMPLAYLIVFDYVSLTSKAEDTINGTFEGVLRNMSAVAGREGLFNSDLSNIKEILNMEEEEEED